MKPAWAIVLAGACALACDRREETNPAAPPGPRYYIIGKNGVQTRDARKLLPGFGLVIVDQHPSGGEWIGRTSLGREVAMKDLRPAKPSRFAGVLFDMETLGGFPNLPAMVRGQQSWPAPHASGMDFGWVVQEGAPVYPLPDPTTKPIARRARYARLTLASPDGPQGFYRVTDGWMSETDLRVPHRSPRPPAVADDEPWLDVELATQTLVAYLGDKPVFATLVATGVGADGTPFATPKGIHRVRAKLLAATMDNLEHTGVVPYSYEEVPFTQYIGRVALHGAFWHDQFGIPRSHGCINLSLADAEWLFSFTKPALIAGESEATATERKPGTVVRVR